MARQLVVQFIDCIPKVTSHYSRKKSPNVAYLQEDVSSKSFFFEKYELWLQLNHPGQPRVSKRHFEDCLTTDFPNLKFSKPKSDTCKYCDNNIMRQGDSSLTEAALSKLVRELATHQLKAQRGYEITGDFKGMFNE